jgi:hypothetical protein
VGSWVLVTGLEALGNGKAEEVTNGEKNLSLSIHLWITILFLVSV